MASSSSKFNYLDSVYHLILFHKVDRDIYDQLIAHGISPDVSRIVVALLVWLYNTGINVIPYLRNNVNNAFAFIRLTAEAEFILDCLRRDSPPRESALAIPVIASLTTRPIDLGFFHFHRHEAAERIAETLTASRFFLDDALFATFRRYEEAVEDARRRNTAPPHMPPELARPCMPFSLTDETSVDQRSLILTFLATTPFTEHEIAVYFAEKWGDCVERVVFEEIAASSSMAQFCARVVFKREGYVALVLHDSPVFRFSINAKQVWARRVEQRRN
ncbi:hypothetical protein ZIOFF_033791 [Zingiber officinale]|uniref:Uncharacterized protein n=1 Tax=Zingiber officinale TaxID=94328 RepID=A0A8J5LCT9_ZINOF|nr:hypothetical protein ZIOFF_037306 [Zingiber officinale]KAG6508417.1 hypothetical protein ZIOFF_033791 [Zingiber officinale]